MSFWEVKIINMTIVWVHVHPGTLSVTYPSSDMIQENLLVKSFACLLQRLAILYVFESFVEVDARITGVPTPHYNTDVEQKRMATTAWEGCQTTTHSICER